MSGLTVTVHGIQAGAMALADRGRGGDPLRDGWLSAPPVYVPEPWRASAGTGSKDSAAEDIREAASADDAGVGMTDRAARALEVDDVRRPPALLPDDRARELLAAYGVVVAPARAYRRRAATVLTVTRHEATLQGSSHAAARLLLPLPGGRPRPPLVAAGLPVGLLDVILRLALLVADRPSVHRVEAGVDGSVVTTVLVRTGPATAGGRVSSPAA